MYFGSKVIHRPHHVFVYTYTRNVCGLSFHLCMAAMVTDTLYMDYNGSLVLFVLILLKSFIFIIHGNMKIQIIFN